MSDDNKNPKSEPIKDLEVLSDEELENVTGGEDLPTGLPSCCKTSSKCGGGGCGTGTGQENEANFKDKTGNVSLDPLSKSPLTKR